MKRISFILLCALLLVTISGCAVQEQSADIAATTLPVYQFTTMLTSGTDLTVTRLVTEEVSCLHDYSLNVRQVKAAEQAQLIIMNGAGLEDFMAELLSDRKTVDASRGITLLDGCHGHDHGEHHHEADSHIWLSPSNAMVMARNICEGLTAKYPQHQTVFEENLAALLLKLQALQDYGQQKLENLSSRELITFHDGFSYFAHAFDLHILAAVEEEAGSETSSKKLIELIELVRAHSVSAVFTESNGSDASAKVIVAETGIDLFTLDMAMAGDDYFAAMRHNIDTIWEALQ